MCSLVTTDGSLYSGLELPLSDDDSNIDLRSAFHTHVSSFAPACVLTSLFLTDVRMSETALEDFIFFL